MDHHRRLNRPTDSAARAAADAAVPGGPGIVSLEYPDAVQANITEAGYR
jgi:hypothetical protein